MSEESVSVSAAPAVVSETPVASTTSDNQPVVNSDNPVQVTPDVTSSGEVKPEVKVDTKLASRFAALSKKEKALENKERELAELKQKAELYENRKSSAKEDPLKFLQEEHGISFDDLTNAILHGKVPEPVDPVKEKLAALEEKIAKQEALLKEKEEAAIRQEQERQKTEYTNMVINDMKEFPLASEYLTADDVINKVILHFQEKNEIRPHKEVLAEIEAYYESKLEAITKIDKVKSKFGTPAAAPVKSESKVVEPTQQEKLPVTLSNHTGGTGVPMKSVDDMTPSELREYQINKLKAMRAK